jgi:hypothetical protein
LFITTNLFNDALFLRLKPIERMIIRWLIDHADHKSAKCFPKIETLAEETGFCMRTVSNAIKNLQDSDAIVIGKRKSKTGWNNNYDLSYWTKYRSKKPEKV